MAVMLKSIGNKEYFASLLRTGGYKATPGRIALLHTLFSSKKPLSIKEIVRELASSKVDQATVYRILSILEDLGVVRQVNLRHGHADYEFVDANDHHHLVCVKCKRVEDIPGCDPEQVGRQVLAQAKSFSRITQHSFEFFGVCKSCDEH
jgi:Fe2+ or Zn2+ uptake regulation protein